MTTAGAIPSEFIRRVPIFAAFSEDALSSIASLLESGTAKAGEVIFREGDQGDEMFIIAAGQLRVVSDAATEKVVFSHLGPGEFFGEMALFTGAPRSAAVIATTDADLWRLRKADFEAIQSQHPEISLEITRILGERVRRGNAQQFQNEAFTLLTLTP